MKKVLVTGGAGFIGSHVVDALLAMGCVVMSYDCLMPQVHPDSPSWPAYQPPRDGLFLHFGDVRDPRAMMFALQDFRPDTVVHLAAMVGVGQSQHDAARYTSANVTGTANLLHLLLEYNSGVRLRREQAAQLLAVVAVPADGQSQEDAQALYLERIAPTVAKLREQPDAPVEQVFVAGSMSSYGEGPYYASDMISAIALGALGVSYGMADDDVHSVDPTWEPSPAAWNPPGMTPAPAPEWWPMRPASVYAWTKQQQEVLALLLWQTRGAREGLAVKVGRFFNAYGPNQSLTNPYTGVAAIFSARVKAGLQPVIFEDGGQLRDFTHVSDVASAVLAILERGVPGTSYNVGTGTPTSVLQVAQAICAGTDIQPEVTQVRRVGDVRHCYADASLLRALGWEPSIGVAEGLAGLREWVGQQPEELTLELLDRANADLVKYGLLQAPEVVE